MTKSEILSALRANRGALIKAFDGLSDAAMQEPGVIDDWSVKDIGVTQLGQKSRRPPHIQAKGRHLALSG